MPRILIIGEPTEAHYLATQIMLMDHPKIEIVVAQQTKSPFDREPLRLIPLPILPTLKEMYDKKGKLLPLPKSKFHK
jgi:hypothetical protein